MLTKTETFNIEIPLAMCNARVLASYDPSRKFMPTDSWLLTEHIFKKTQASDCGTETFPGVIRQTARLLVAERSENLGESEDIYVRLLIKAAAANMGVRKTLDHLYSTSDDFAAVACEADRRRKSTTNHLVAAAACLGDLPFFERSIKEGEIDSSENIYFGNPLQCAILRGHYDATKYMLDHGVSVSQSDRNGLSGTVLCAVAVLGRQDFVNLIFEPKYNFHTYMHNYGSAIEKAAFGGHMEIARLLVKRCKDWKLIKTGVLWDAVQDGAEATVRLALENGANPNEGRARRAPWDPFGVAAAKGYDNIMRLLLEYGANPCFGDALGLGRGNKKAVGILAEYGMRVDNPTLGRVGFPYNHALDSPRALRVFSTPLKTGYKKVVRLFAG